MLGQLPDAQGEVLLKQMFKQDPLTTLRVIQRHFGFEDLVFADDEGIDALLDLVGTDALAVALHEASDALLRRFSDRMGTGLARTFIEDVHAGQPGPQSVQSMRNMILMKALILKKKGRLRVSRPGIEV